MNSKFYRNLGFIDGMKLALGILSLIVTCTLFFGLFGLDGLMSKWEQRMGGSAAEVEIKADTKVHERHPGPRVAQPAKEPETVATQPNEEAGSNSPVPVHEQENTERDEEVAELHKTLQERKVRFQQRIEIIKKTEVTLTSKPVKGEVSVEQQLEEQRNAFRRQANTARRRSKRPNQL